MFPQLIGDRASLRKEPLNSEEVRRLFELTDWRVVLLDEHLPREYNNINTLSIFKAFALPFIIEISSERALFRELLERERLRKLCCFLPGEKLPEERTFWHFRKKFSTVFSELMYKILISFVLSGKQPNFNLPFVLPITDLEKGPDSRSFEIKLDNYRPPIEIWATLSETNENDDLSIDKLKERLRHSNNMSQWRELVTEFEKNSKFPKKGLSGNLGLPLEVRTILHNGEIVHFAIYQPAWLETPTQYLDTVTTIGSSSFHPYYACHVIVLRDWNGIRQILLGKRKSGYGKDTYTLPGGKQIEGETLEECAIRELGEETRLKLIRSRPVSLHVSRYPGKPQVTSIGVLAVEYEGILYTVEQSQNEYWQWFDLDNLPAALFDPTKIIIEHFLRDKYLNLEWPDVESRREKVVQPSLF